MASAPDTDGAFIADGTLVDYRGSVRPMHGQWTARRCTCRHCWMALVGGIVAGVPVGLPDRFELIHLPTGFSPLVHVRRTSITPLTPA